MIDAVFLIVIPFHVCMRLFQQAISASYFSNVFVNTGKQHLAIDDSISKISIMIKAPLANKISLKENTVLSLNILKIYRTKK